MNEKLSQNLITGGGVVPKLRLSRNAFLTTPVGRLRVPPAHNDDNDVDENANHHHDREADGNRTRTIVNTRPFLKRWNILSDNALPNSTVIFCMLNAANNFGMCLYCKKRIPRPEQMGFPGRRSKQEVLQNRRSHNSRHINKRILTDLDRMNLRARDFQFIMGW